MTSFPHISVWRMRDAPEEYRRHCPPTWIIPDDDHANVKAAWLAYVPPDSGWIGWLESKEFTCCEVFEHQFEGGAYIVVGAHSPWCDSGEVVPRPVDTSRVIRVWRYGDERADVLVPSTDDADWVAQVHRDFVSANIAWLESGSNFGCSGVHVHQLPDGSELLIGCHS